MPPSLQEQIQKIEEQQQARARGRQRRREQHKAEADGAGGFGKGEGKGGHRKRLGNSFKGGGKGGDATQGKGGDQGTGKGGSRGPKRHKPRPTDPLAPIAERSIAEAETNEAARKGLGREGAISALRSSMATRDAEVISAALAQAKQVGVNTERGSAGAAAIEEAEIYLIELQIERGKDMVSTETAAEQAAPRRPLRAAQQLRCMQCFISFCSSTELAGHLCFGSLPEQEDAAGDAAESVAQSPVENAAENAAESAAAEAVRTEQTIKFADSSAVQGMGGHADGHTSEDAARGAVVDVGASAAPPTLATSNALGLLGMYDSDESEDGNSD